MVEGRIAQGVIVGDKSDIGGGASTLGTLSGGNEVIISIGESCLLGANSGLGIPLGDRCTIESGLYVTGSSKVVPSAAGTPKLLSTLLSSTTVNDIASFRARRLTSDSSKKSVFG